MMLVAKCSGTYFKHFGKRIIARNLSLSSCHSRVQQNNEKKIEESNPHSITQRKKLTEKEIQKIINLDNIHLESKVRKRTAEREPLVQNFFIGKVDRELLTYPQVIDKDDYEKLVETLDPVHSYFQGKSTKCFDTYMRDINSEAISDLKGMHIFGRDVPQKFGGLGYFYSERNLASECENIDVKFAEIISGHRLAAEVISTHGTDSQKDKYLLELGRGNLIGSVCLQDFHSEAFGCITAVLDTSKNKPEWILNGSRSFVVKSIHSNLLIVTAMVEKDSKHNDQMTTKQFITFLVDPKAHGITFSDISNTIGCNEVPYVTLNFASVRLNEGNVLSEKHDNCTAAEKLIRCSRIQTATISAIQTKHILNHFIKNVICSSHNGVKMIDFEVFRHNIAKLARDLYALESMIYLTVGVMDAYENPKIDIESVIIKAFSMNMMSKVVKLMLNFPAVINGQPSEEHIKNAIQLQFSGESIEKLKSFIGLSGLQHCHNIIGHRVRSHSDSIISKLIKGTTIHVVNRDLYLKEYVHPSLEQIIDRLEESIARMHIGTEILLHRFGSSAEERHIDVRRLGESAILNYAMFASVGRASRSYCIGLRHSVYETVVAGCMVDAGSKKILELMLNIKNDAQNDEKYQSVAKYVVNAEFTWPSAVLHTK